MRCGKEIDGVDERTDRGGLLVRRGMFSGPRTGPETDKVDLKTEPA